MNVTLSGVQGVFLFSRYITNFLVEGKVCGIEGKKPKPWRSRDGLIHF